MSKDANLHKKIISQAQNIGSELGVLAGTNISNIIEIVECMHKLGYAKHRPCPNCASLKEDIDTLSKQVDEVSKEITRANEENVSLKQANSKLESENKKLKERALLRHGKLAQYDEYVQELKKDRQDFEKQLLDKRIQLQRLTKENELNKDIKEQLESLKQEKITAIDLCTQQVKDNQRLQKEIKEARELIDNHKLSYTEYQEKKAEWLKNNEVINE